MILMNCLSVKYRKEKMFNDFKSPFVECVVGVGVGWGCSSVNLH